jgi:hypothetical protein
MHTHSASVIVERLRGAGLNLSLAPTGGQTVAPSSHLTEDLRALIRDSKALLIDWAKATNDVCPADWHALVAAYLAHHFNCPTCIAAGRGSRHGPRCVGAAL